VPDGETVVTVFGPDGEGDAPPEGAAAGATAEGATSEGASSEGAPGASDASAGFKVATAMPMDGDLDAGRVVSELNLQLGDLHGCVPVIRETDTVVGSLNVQIAVAADGAVTADLQSPVNDRAKACLLEGMKAWKIESGQGRSMVLLELTGATQ
jgi:hypothetical protein